MLLTFTEFLLEDTEKPTVIHKLHFRGLKGEDDYHHFEIKHPSFGNDSIGAYVAPPDKNGHSAGVNVIGNGLAHANKLGAGNMKHVLGRIKHHLPELKSLAGRRESGARGITGTYDPDANAVGTHAKANIEHIKPIKPSTPEEAAEPRLHDMRKK